MVGFTPAPRKVSETGIAGVFGGWVDLGDGFWVDLGNGFEN